MRLLLVIFQVATLLLLAGCAHYADLKVGQAKGSPGRIGKALIVEFEPVLPDKSFEETVWDNVSGAIWDPSESRKIGFSQDYQGSLFAVTLPPGVAQGMVASGSLPVVKSRIMVPFGRVVSDHMVQLAAQASTQATICFTERCAALAKERTPGHRHVRVRFERLSVQERTTNRLTLEGQGRVIVEDPGQPLNTAAFSRQLVDQSVTSEGGFHSDFVRAMNKIVNEFASQVVMDILVASSQGQ